MSVPEETPEAYIIDELEQPVEERTGLRIEAPTYENRTPRLPAQEKQERGVCIIDISPE